MPRQSLTKRGITVIEPNTYAPSVPILALSGHAPQSPTQERTVASNKNQHFVPRCYLKPFTLNGEGLAISLLNVDQHRLVLTAPVKHQCSGDYFYGKDLQIEKALQHIEGLYANSLTR